MLLQAVVLGAAAGLFGLLFSWGSEHLIRASIEGLGGVALFRPHGDGPTTPVPGSTFTPWVVALVPAIGGLLAGLVLRFAPEARGGGGDAMIRAFHEQDGYIRPRVLAVKMIASILTLGTGGSGGREGPTMHAGGALGSIIASVLGVGPRERRVLLVAGVAAGIAAVFRTPLGAALIAVEVLYRDGFESESLIPSVFSSVVAYSIVSTVLGESRLFAVPGRFTFDPRHLPLFALLAVVIALVAGLFLATMRRSRALFNRLPVPDPLRPALGGLMMGLVVAAFLAWKKSPTVAVAYDPGLLGTGYGALQVTLTGAPWLSGSWYDVQVFLLLALGKIVTSSLTIGSGGSAGDFAPSLVIGGLVGAAFGHTLLRLGVPGVEPAAFALVGMAAFYGGIAHVPLAALVMVCELAGNYDLLVPLMLALGVAFVLLRKRALYESQRAAPSSPEPARAQPGG